MKMDSKRNFEQNLIDQINNEIGNDFKKLHRASTVKEHYQKRLQEIKKKLIENDEISIPVFKSAFECHKQATQSLDVQREKLDLFSGKVVKYLNESNKAINAVEKDLLNVGQTQLAIHYVKIVKDVQELNNLLTNALNSKDETKMVNAYLTLFEDNDHENSVVGRLKDIDASYLKSFAIRTAAFWHEVLIEKFSNELADTLKTMRWGLKDTDFLNHLPTREHFAKAQLLAEYLFLIKSPIDDAEPIELLTSGIIFQPLSKVTEILLAPYRQRFLFHFTGLRQTNRYDKPEWFYTQVINWAKESHLFVGQTFQSSATSAGKLDFNIRLEFLRGLVQLIIEKLSKDIEKISQDEILFAHLLDETLAFEYEWRDRFGYPPSFPSAISIITQPVYLLKWIALEESFCAEKMDFILQGENPWQLIDPNIYDDDLKIPKCADQFIRLLEAIKDRYYSLIQPGHQLQFLTLQLELIDNFKRRLVQMHSSRLVESIPILNAINYITMVLREWGENVHYLHLHAALVGPNAEEVNSVFSNCVNELDNWIEQLIKDLAKKVVHEVKAHSMPYRHHSWSTMPEQNSKEPFLLSSSAGEMFQVLLTILHNLDSELSVNLFNITIRLIAKQIDDFFMDSLILHSKFSPAGAAQFNYDMSRNLFSCFGQYCRKPELLFKKIHDSTKLLTADRKTALIIHEKLRKDDSLEEKMNCLKGLGVINFKTHTCIEVLERRTDIRVEID